MAVGSFLFLKEQLKGSIIIAFFLFLQEQIKGIIIIHISSSSFTSLLSAFNKKTTREEVGNFSSAAAVPVHAGLRCGQRQRSVGAEYQSIVAFESFRQCVSVKCAVSPSWEVVCVLDTSLG